MSAILDLPAVQDRLILWSVEEYEKLGEAGFIGTRTELIRGVLLKKLPKTPLHTYLVHAIYEDFLKVVPAGYTAHMHGPLRLKDSEPEPDISVMRGSDRDFDHQHPTTAELVIEIADGSAALDRENASLYAEAEVAECWIVLAQERQIEVYRQPVGGVYQQRRLYAISETLVCESVPGLPGKLEDFFPAPSLIPLGQRPH